MFKTIKSFLHAFQGLKSGFKSQLNIKIQFLAAFLVLLAARFFQFKSYEYVLVLLCIGMVITAELLNTAIELICDYIQPAQHEKIKQIKDIAAAAVLWSSFMAFLIGMLLFIPKIL